MRFSSSMSRPATMARYSSPASQADPSSRPSRYWFSRLRGTRGRLKKYSVWAALTILYRFFRPTWFFTRMMR